MSATLQDVITVMKEDASDQLEVQLDQVTILESLNFKFDEFLLKLELMQMRFLEMSREMQPAGSPRNDEPREIEPDASGSLGIVAAVTASLSGLAVGFVEGIAKSINATLKLLKVDRLFKPITKMIDNAFGRGSKMAKVLDDLIVRSYTFIDDFIIKPFRKFGENIKSFFKPVSDLLTRFGKFLDPAGDVGKLGSSIGKMFSPIIKGAKTVKGIFSNFTGVFSKFFTAAKALGNVVGKLFIPVTIIMGIVDTITGAIDGFKNEEGSIVEKVIGGIFGGIKGLINGLLLIPLDLIKSAVSWIGEKLGFENFSAALDSFSFSDLFSEGVDIIKNMFLGFIDTFKNEEGGFDFASIAKGLLGNIVNAITLPIRGMLNAIANAVDMIPFAGDAADKIRGFADAITVDTGLGESVSARVSGGAEQTPEPAPVPEPEPAPVPEPEPAPVPETDYATSLESAQEGQFLTAEQMRELGASASDDTSEPVPAPAPEPVPEPAPVPAPEPPQPKVQKLPKYVSIDAVTGKFRAFNPNMQKYALFDEIKQAQEFIVKKSKEQIALEKQMDEEFQLMMQETEGVSAATRAETAPRVAQSQQLDAATNKNMNLKEEKESSSSANLVVAPSSNNNITTNNNTYTSQGMLQAADMSDRSHLSTQTGFTRR